MARYEKYAKEKEMYQQVNSRIVEILMVGLEGTKRKGLKEYGSEIVQGILYSAGMTKDYKRPLYLTGERYTELIQLRKKKEKLEKKLDIIGKKFEDGRQ